MNFLKQIRYFLLLIFLIGIFTDIFILKSSNDLIILFLSLVWVLSASRRIGFGLESRFSILGSIIFLISAAFFLFLQSLVVAEKLAVWAYMFFLIGIFQQLKENKKGFKDLVNLNSLWKSRDKT